MKPSDLVTTSGQRYEATQNLLQTEETDAVNTGLVRSAERDALPVGRRAAKGGVTSAALEAATRGHRDRFADSPDGSATSTPEDYKKGSDVVSSGPLTGAGKVASDTAPNSYEVVTRHRRRNHSQDAYTDGNAATEAVASRHSLRSTLNKTAKTAATDVATKKVLENTELEGTDDLYYKGRTGYRAARGAGRLALRGGRGLVRTARSARDRLFDRSKGGKGTTSMAQAQRQAQAASYAKRTIYTTAAETRQAAAAAKAATTISGTVAKGGFGKALAALASPTLVVILLIVCLVLCIAGAAGEQERRNTAMDGLPGWVTYDLVIACLEARDEYGYPASAMLGQMMIENGTSDEGSTLGRDYHNYGGVKYAGNNYGGLITGSVRLLTTEYTSTGTAYQTYADFAVFASDEAYMTYRCEYLYKQSNYTSVPEFQQAIDENDSELFLTALGYGGYYTAPTSEYLAHYQSICEAYPLVPLLDSMTVEEFQSNYSGSFTGGGEEYEEAEDWQKRIADACRTTPSPGSGLCAAWVSNVYERAGQARPYGNGNSILSNSTTTSTNWDEIQVGQILSAQATPTPDGAIYGHTAIYVGDGMVMENLSGTIETTPLSEWISYYSQFGWVMYGWPW